MKDAVQCFAIVRVDEFLEPGPPETTVAVKVIVWSLEEAVAEVARLNALNASKRCRYSWQTTRAKARR